MNEDLKRVYGWVRQTREILFEYTASLPANVYTLERPDFAYGSIRNIHAHVADCYLWWVGQIGLKLERSDLDPLSIPDVNAMRARFAEVDAVVDEALEKFDRPDEVIRLEHPRVGALKLTQRWLIMHPITHEFHHKGQLLALGRVLGHPQTQPQGRDTDLVLPA